MGLIKVSAGDLWFEASNDGSGTVYLIQYHLDTTCSPLPCLRRAQTVKLAGDPLANATAQVANYQTELDNVLNGTTANPIFQAYDTNGNLISPTDMSNNALASINSVSITIEVQSPTLDPKTKVYPTVTLFSTVKLNNCSAAWTSDYLMGC